MLEYISNVSIMILIMISSLLLIIVYVILYINSKLVVTKYKFSDYQIEKVDGNDWDYSSHNIMLPASCDLSVVLPAYLEEATCDYLDKRKEQNPSFTYELIVVDDGSRDNTSKVVIDFIRQNQLQNVVFLIKFPKNKGKGFAVKQGVLKSRGIYILMADADNATEISDLEKLENKLREIESNNGHGMSVGSRAHMAQGVTRERKWYRNLLMHGWHFLVKHVAGVSHIEDTQCGFKLFTRETAKLLFLNLKIDRWSFDIDLFRIASKLNIPVVEVPVNWREIEGSKMNLRGIINMGMDLLLLRLYYLFNLWTVKKDVTLPTE